MRIGTRLMVLGVACWLALSGTAMAQDNDAANLAKVAQNPLATMVTLPLQANFNSGYYYNSTHPEGAAESQVRFQLNFMFPTKAK